MEDAVYKTIFYWIALGAGVISFIFSALLIIGKSAFVKINSFFNKEFSVEKFAKVLDKVIAPVDDWIMVRPRIAGLLLLVISIYLIFMAVSVLFYKI